jgi:arylsulfatase A-like enzyme
MTPWDRQLSTLAMGGACWAFLTPNRVRGTGAAALGTAVGFALCTALVLWTYMQGVLQVPRVLPWQGPLSQVIVFALVLASATFWESLRGRPAALPSFASLSVVALGLALGGTAFAFLQTRPQTSLTRDPDPKPVASLPDIFVLVLDTVRADHLSSYGYDRDTTPNLRRFLAEHREAVQYDLAFSPASWTVPAHASLLTGTMPSVHQARSSGKQESFLGSATKSLALVAEETLAEVLSDAGYCTAAVVANAYLLRVDGLQRGFETFSQPHATRPLQLLGEALRWRFIPGAFIGRIKPYPSAEAINTHGVRIHRECAPRPSFVLANYMEAHSPYLAPSPHAGLFAGDHHFPIALGDAVLSDPAELVALKRDRYDENLHFLDAQLERLFAELEATRVMQRAWLFITADHGEAFHEHGTTSHGSSIYNEQVRVPLIVKPPRGVRLPPTREPVSLLDVTATIAAIAGRGGFGAGHDLRQPVAPGRMVQIEFRGGFRRSVDEYGATADDPARAVVRGRWKLLERGGSHELYDLAADPTELTNRGREQQEILQTLASHLPIWGSHETDRTKRIRLAREFGRDLEETLLKLGYVQ